MNTKKRETLRVGVFALATVLPIVQEFMRDYHTSDYRWHNVAYGILKEVFDTDEVRQLVNYLKSK